MTIDFYNQIDKGRGYQLIFIPSIVLSKTKWCKKAKEYWFEYDFHVGWLFWSMKISWEVGKINAACVKG